MKKFVLVFVCLLLVAPVATCFGNERHWGLGVGAGAALLRGADDDEEGGFGERAKLGPYGAFKFRKGLKCGRMSLGIGIGYGYNYDEDLTTYRTNLIPVDLEFVYNFMHESKATPYLSASLGVVRWDSNFRPEGIRLEKERDPAAGVGAGVEVFLNDVIALDIGGKFRYFLTDDEDLIGRSRDLEITSNDHFLWTFGVGLMWYPAKGKDTDGDGVSDCRDRCPDTQAGCTVDEFGCPKDSDGDGVCDGKDKCPDTPKDCPVDANGCPKDSDGDGVWDCRDKSPDTPRGVLVDEFGRPRDSDGDGVSDDKDKCPDTPRGVVVDEFGCPKCDPSELEGITFQFDKSDIVPAPNPTLDHALDLLLNGCRGVKVEIHGHTDWVGSDEYNMKLGLRRAEATKKYLVDHGVSADDLTTKSFGESQPVADNKTKEGRAKNRRIELHVAK